MTEQPDPARPITLRDAEAGARVCGVVLGTRHRAVDIRWWDRIRSEPDDVQFSETCQAWATRRAIALKADVTAEGAGAWPPQAVLPQQLREGLITRVVSSGDTDPKSLSVCLADHEGGK